MDRFEFLKILFAAFAIFFSHIEYSLGDRLPRCIRMTVLILFECAMIGLGVVWIISVWTS